MGVSDVTSALMLAILSIIIIIGERNEPPLSVELSEFSLYIYENEPGNYRGITLLNVMGKIFTTIIRDRLMDWAEESNCLSDVQFGFRQGRRTCFPIFIINSAIQYYKKKSIPVPIYACFVDFQKAFDSVNHAHL